MKIANYRPLFNTLSSRRVVDVDAVELAKFITDAYVAQAPDKLQLLRNHYEKGMSAVASTSNIPDVSAYVEGKLVRAAKLADIICSSTFRKCSNYTPDIIDPVSIFYQINSK
jgi:hypothetical protein